MGGVSVRARLSEAEEARVLHPNSTTIPSTTSSISLISPTPPTDLVKKRGLGRVPHPGAPDRVPPTALIPRGKSALNLVEDPLTHIR